MSTSTMQAMVVDHNAEREFRMRFMNLISSAVGLTHVRTAEQMRALISIRAASLVESNVYHEWDIRNGMREFTLQNLLHVEVQSDGSAQQVPQALQIIWEKYLWYMNEASDEEKAKHYIYVLVNPHYYLGQNPQAWQYFMEMCAHLPESTVRVVIVTDDTPLPETYGHYFVSLDFERPGHSEMKERLRSTLEDFTSDSDPLDLSEEDMDAIVITSMGMVAHDFDVAVSRTIIDTAFGTGSDEDEEEGARQVTLEKLIAGVSKAKTEAIKKSDILELLPSGNIDDVGGLDIAKKWVEQRANCYSEEAMAFGAEPPKGAVFVGVPGTGKSLLAKAVAATLGVPVVRLDFGRVFNALVGSSEERMRKALKLVESMAPCVCFVDEIDKGLGGIGGGGGDSGTSQRVLGTFLTWLNDHNKSVFTMVTANNITGLPPELLRRGRFDQIFSTTMPNEFEREDVLAIHLRKRNHSIDEFTNDELVDFLKATADCVPAEIEAIVKDGIVLALNDPSLDEPVLLMRHLLQARKEMVPLSISHKDAISAMREWAAKNAIPASYTEEQLVKEHGRVKRTAGGSKAPAKSRAALTSITGGKKTRRPTPTRRRRTTEDKNDE